MKVIALLAMVASSSAVAAAPCSNVSRALTELQKAAWAPAIASQLQTESVEVAQSFAVGQWHIVGVNTPNSDPPFLFFSKSPEVSTYVTIWSGAARSTETKEIKAWAIRNARGIPEPLAACFAWFITRARQ